MRDRQGADRWRKPVFAVLRELIRGEPGPDVIAPVMRTFPDELTEAALAQGLGPALAAAICDRGPVPDTLRTATADAHFAHAASSTVLTAIDDVLAAAGIPWVALKGPVVASHYTQPSLRGFRDLDVLVNGRDLGAAIEALASAGIEDVNRNWGEYLRHGVAETPLWTPGIAVDLHWHLVAMGRRRSDITIDIAGVIERRRRLDIGGIEVWAPDHVDLLVHLCLHAALGGSTRAMWLRDIREVAAARPPDWEELRRRARQYGVAGFVGSMLDRARCIADAAVPAGVPAALCPRALLGLRARIDRRDGGAGLPHRFLRGQPIRLAGDGRLRAVPRAAAAELRARFVEQPDWNVGSPDGPLYWNRPSGGPAARREYLDFAARSGNVGGQRA